MSKDAQNTSAALTWPEAEILRGDFKEIFRPILADDRMREVFTAYLARTVYDQVRAWGETRGE